MQGLNSKAVRLIGGVHVPDPVSLRETHWGCIIRSEIGGETARLFAGIGTKLAALAGWAAVAGAWLVPGPVFAVKAAATVVILVAVYLGLVLLRRAKGYELQVDLYRRELRAAVLTPDGGSRVTTTARFEQVGDSVLRRDAVDPATWHLDLSLKGRSDLIRVASGDEPTLMAVYDRLVRDLRPVEERVPGLNVARLRDASRAARVFPQLGPDHMSA